MKSGNHKLKPQWDNISPLSNLQKNLKSDSTKCLVKIQTIHKLLINLFGEEYGNIRIDSTLVPQPHDPTPKCPGTHKQVDTQHDSSNALKQPQHMAERERITQLCSIPFHDILRPKNAWSATGIKWINLTHIMQKSKLQEYIIRSYTHMCVYMLWYIQSSKTGKITVHLA